MRFRAIALTLRAGLHKLPVMSSLEPALDAGREHDSPSQRLLPHFMNKFRTITLIDYNGELTVRTELLTDLVLHN
jgi:hypothetical protein